MTAIMSCSSRGYKPSPDIASNMVCSAQGKWTYQGGTFVSCVSDGGTAHDNSNPNVGCMPPYNPTNGVWAVSPFATKAADGVKLVVGTIATIKCNQPYSSSVQGASITCDGVNGQGQWTGSAGSELAKCQ